MNGLVSVSRKDRAGASDWVVCVCVCDALYRPGPSACAGLMEFAQPPIGKSRNHIMSLKDSERSEKQSC